MSFLFFFFYNTLTAKLHGNGWAEKQIAIFFPVRKFWTNFQFPLIQRN